MNILDVVLKFIGLVGAQQWAAAASLAFLWLWHATQDWSNVPLKQTWQPALFVVFGTGYGVLQAVLGGMAWNTALFHGLGTAFLTYGLAQLVLGALFAGKTMPKWLATLLLLFPAPQPVPAPPDANAVAPQGK